MLASTQWKILRALARGLVSSPTMRATVALSSGEKRMWGGRSARYCGSKSAGSGWALGVVENGEVGVRDVFVDGVEGHGLGGVFDRLLEIEGAVARRFRR